ncbi:hypothetical protein MVLG_05555 [Microbotryum lychnidis-dioicae p1A1 Lamole]|uniref:1-phosphatidylinositol 4-kinase n=1 Tax=Microbotryum lychnidis-dioicae (strain p1A1 Lamole / MvSl-1064) TaxID=683840 RepID=U5HEL2_USTV1|nr:hypothetical protein MVLG_05555 [Microbotryum lychnidis-dioicae p1A1 Lamole]|eukprot:KDE03986.1 hypothetical protein MVLG_05555 [Microbotryum lychnidis-dioicae p1A1 Lamole]
MDYLDSNLHSAILSSLAANLASSSTHDDVHLLTESFAGIQPVTNGVIGGVLNRINGDSHTASGGAHTLITLSQVDGIIAFCDYAAKAPAKSDNLNRLLVLLQGAPNWQLEAAVGVQVAQDYAPGDRLAYSLVSAALIVAGASPNERTAALGVLSQFHKALLAAIETSEGHRIIGYLLPALNGARRAVGNSPFPWTVHDELPLTPEPSRDLVESVVAAIAYEWDPSTEGGRVALATLKQYDSSMRGLSPGLIALVQIEFELAYWTSAIVPAVKSGGGWRALLEGDPASITAGGQAAYASATRAHGTFENTYTMLERMDGEYPPDPYAFDVLLSSLKLAVVATIATGSPTQILAKLFDDLLTHPATVVDEPLQTGAVESLQVFARAFPSTLPTALNTIRNFISSPSPVLEQSGVLAPSSTMIAASACYASLINLSTNPALRESAIQSLLNHFVVPEREPLVRQGDVVANDAKSIRSLQEAMSDPIKVSVSSNVVHAVARLALTFKDEQITTLVTSILLQRLVGTSPVVDGAILFELSELATIVNADTFADILAGISRVSKHAKQDEAMSQTLLNAQTRLAIAASSRQKFHVKYLSETLALFVEEGGAGDRKTTASERAAGLLNLVPILDAFLTGAKFDSRQDVDGSLVSLFRSAWYLIVLSGFVSTPSRIADWQRAALVRIAQRTPGLLRGIKDDFVATELDFNPILRNKEHVLSPDAARQELAAILPSAASFARSLPAPQVVFLLTVVRLESLRAEAGQPSIVLSYFHVQGINENPQLYALMTSIAEHVNNTFVSRLSQLVTGHTMDPAVYHEVREILLQCCHTLGKVRTTAIRYLNDLFTSFPSLLCSGEVVSTMLELLTVTRRACLAEFVDEYTPLYRFHSSRANFDVVLPDDYSIRNSVLTELHRYARSWLKAGLTRAPSEMRGLLQDYIDGTEVAPPTTSLKAFADDEMGKSVAIDLIRMPPSNAREASLPAWGEWRADNSSNFARTFGAKSFFGGEASRTADTSRDAILDELEALAEQLDQHKMHVKLVDIRALLYRSGGHLVKAQSPDPDILQQLVHLPARIFTDVVIEIATEVWTWVVDARPELEPRLMVEVAEAWQSTIQRRQGLFSCEANRKNPLDVSTQFTPTDKDYMTKEFIHATRLLQPHMTLLQFLSSRFQAFRYRDTDLVHACMRILKRSTDAAKSWSTHQLAREIRMRMLSFGFCVLQGSELESAVEYNFRDSLYEAAMTWFELPPGWTYGSNRIQLKADLQAMEELHSTIKSDKPAYDYILSASRSRKASGLPYNSSAATAGSLQTRRQQLLLALLENEMDRLKLWTNPLLDPKRGAIPTPRSTASDANWVRMANIAWSHWPGVAVQLPERTKLPAVAAEVTRLVRSNPLRAQHIPDALQYFVGDKISPESERHLRVLLFWAPVSVISALRFLFPLFEGDPILLQYALRVLEHHPVEITFFYIPQVVQALRFDELGYAERFIFETSKISQLFCHQIIWNMKANAYRGDDGDVEDPMKPTLDRMVDMIVSSLSGDAKDFFQREFAFFNEVTSISAKLKPFIKSSKHEKKAKIDEEMAKIKVDVGVYLPSNPDGIVVDVDRKSGRPLQSHAKAPFMATFKVRRDHKRSVTADLDAQDALIEDGESSGQVQPKSFDTWQSAIFKVGDDCRQDVLALQIIAMHKNIFTALGLDLLVTPYRVTATGPGCGVIDVIPNATSRDEMGRAKVNDLKSFFVLKYGSPDGIEFQRARNNFIQSMAAYSLLCYIVQIKDRHNGNIMIDGKGCITHIDFGFLFDIGPGGVKFEPSSFKLSHEMMVLMGGKDSVGFRHFSELTVKSFLACRPYAQQIVDTARLMLAAEFPSFKGEPTMQRLTERFRLELREDEAAEYMKGVIANAHENPRSIVYDIFQEKTNGIPYVR